MRSWLMFTQLGNFAKSELGTKNAAEKIKYKRIYIYITIFFYRAPGPREVGIHNFMRTWFSSTWAYFSTEFNFFQTSLNITFPNLPESAIKKWYV